MIWYAGCCNRLHLAIDAPSVYVLGLQPEIVDLTFDEVRLNSEGRKQLICCIALEWIPLGAV